MDGELEPFVDNTLESDDDCGGSDADTVAFVNEEQEETPLQQQQPADAYDATNSDSGKGFDAAYYDEDPFESVARHGERQAAAARGAAVAAAFDDVLEAAAAVAIEVRTSGSGNEAGLHPSASASAAAAVVPVSMMQLAGRKRLRSPLPRAAAAAATAAANAEDDDAGSAAPPSRCLAREDTEELDDKEEDALGVSNSEDDTEDETYRPGKRLSRKGKKKAGAGGKAGRCDKPKKGPGAGGSPGRRPGRPRKGELLSPLPLGYSSSSSSSSSSGGGGGGGGIFDAPDIADTDTANSSSSQSPPPPSSLLRRNKRPNTAAQAEALGQMFICRHTSHAAAGEAILFDTLARRAEHVAAAHVEGNEAWFEVDLPTLADGRLQRTTVASLCGSCGFPHRTKGLEATHTKYCEAHVAAAAAARAVVDAAAAAAKEGAAAAAAVEAGGEAGVAVVPGAFFYRHGDLRKRRKENVSNPIVGLVPPVVSAFPAPAPPAAPAPAAAPALELLSVFDAAGAAQADSGYDDGDAPGEVEEEGAAATADTYTAAAAPAPVLAGRGRRAVSSWNAGFQCAHRSHRDDVYPVFATPADRAAHVAEEHLTPGWWNRHLPVCRGSQPWPSCCKLCGLLLYRLDQEVGHANWCNETEAALGPGVRRYVRCGALE